MTLDHFIARGNYNYLRWGYVALDEEVHRALTEMGDQGFVFEDEKHESQEVQMALGGSTYKIMAFNPVARHVPGPSHETQPKRVWLMGASALEELRTRPNSNAIAHLYDPGKDVTYSDSRIKGMLNKAPIYLDARVPPTTMAMLYIYEDEVIYNIATRIWTEAATLTLPKYQSRKIVKGAKIISIVDLIGDCGLELNLEGDQKVAISRDWYVKHSAASGGYYVIYDDGYTSWSPAEAFENGYVKLNGEL